ncbi:hypothetical protein [Spirosoma agri]|uniref:Uncharacterized protein n=1 Tax=Spirosoma agri TaxID=1987381 RepID=A0A6M0IJ21_9BACT|nr:hypothetical protein [Spirosoma agri]NEU68259.1 hypothetical protein [Spirosoma agri]
MESEEDSRPEIQINWKPIVADVSKVSIEDLKFIFAQAEKRLDDSIKNFDITTTKSTSFITLSSTLLTALTAYFFINHDPRGTFDPKLCTVSVTCLYLFAILTRFVWIILPKSIEPIGTYPQDLYNDNVLYEDPKTADNSAKPYIKEIYLTELQSYDRRIQHNETVNQNRQNVFNQSVWLICAMPVIATILYSLLSVCFS